MGSAAVVETPVIGSAILDSMMVWLDEHGEQRHASGLATARMRADLGERITAQWPNADAAGFVLRETNGKRTYSVKLTERGRAWAALARVCQARGIEAVPGRTGIALLLAYASQPASRHGDKAMVELLGYQVAARRQQLESAGWITVERKGQVVSRVVLADWAREVVDACAVLEPVTAKLVGYKRPALALVNEPAIEVSPMHPSLRSADPEPDDGVPAEPEPVPVVTAPAVVEGDMATAIEMMGDALAMMARGLATQMRRPAAPVSELRIAPHGDVERQLGEANARIEVMRNRIEQLEARNRELMEQANRASVAARSVSTTIPRSNETRGASVLDLRSLGVKDSRTRELYRHAIEHGWRIEPTNGGHHRLIPPDPSKGIIHTSKTPSDHRTFDNLHAEMVRAGLPKLGQASAN